MFESLKLPMIGHASPVKLQMPFPLIPWLGQEAGQRETIFLPVHRLVQVSRLRVGRRQGIDVIVIDPTGHFTSLGSLLHRLGTIPGFSLREGRQIPRQLVVKNRVFGIELNRLRQVRIRPGVVPLVGQAGAALKEGLGILGI